MRLLIRSLPFFKISFIFLNIFSNIKEGSFSFEYTPSDTYNCDSNITISIQSD
nr:MAG TPA: hypothetical protein [Bacteriophage sp.]